MEHKPLNRHALGNPHRLWKQNNFVLSTFSVNCSNMRDGLENLADAGFNMVELGWVSHEHAEEALQLCEELDLKLLYQDFTLFGGMQEHHIERHSSPAEIRAVVDHVRPYKTCAGFYAWDEPYRPEETAETRRLLDLFQAESPERMPFSVAIPSYNLLYRWDNGLFQDYLTRFCDQVDPPVLSLDYYPFGMADVYTDEKQLDDSLMWCDLGLMRALCARRKLPLWFYYQGVNLYKYSHFEFPMVRVSMYAAAMYGAKGLQQYTAVGSVIDKDGQKDLFFDDQKQIHREFAKLGNTLMALHSEYVFHSDDLLPGCPYLDGLSDVLSCSKVLTGKLEPRVSVGELADDYGNTYLLPLNRDITLDRTVTLQLQKPMRIYLVSKETGRQQLLCEATENLALELTKGDGALLRVQDAAEQPFTLEYRLEK